MMNQIDNQNKKPKKNWTWIFILIPFLIIATCNYIVNTNDEKDIVKNPKPGNYFVFRGLVSDRDQALKVKTVEKDSIEFYVPMSEMWEFKINKSESKIREMDEKNELYNSNLTLKIAKSTIDSLVENATFGGRVVNQSKTFFITAF